MQVEIYRNLHKKCFSIRHNGKVIDYLYDDQELHLIDVKFRVQPAGRERVRRENKKNVHAYVKGTIAPLGGLQPKKLFNRLEEYFPERYEEGRMKMVERLVAFDLTAPTQSIRAHYKEFIIDQYIQMTDDELQSSHDSMVEE